LPLDESAAFAADLSRGHKKIISKNAFFVSSDVTAEDRLARVLRNAMLSANGW
jgi:hypothetical protein